MNVALLEKISPDETQMRQYYSESLVSLIDSGEPVLAFDADLMRAVGLLPYKKGREKSIYDCGIAEANMVGLAAGVSAEGFVPFVHSFAAFASRRAFDQVFVSGAYARLNVKIVGSDPGTASALNGGTHQANEDIALMRTIPGMTIVEPTDPAMLKNLIPKIAAEYGMCYIRLFRLNAPRIYKDGSDFDIGRSVMLRDGSDASVIACGLEVQEALKAAEMLADEGVSVRVLDMFTVKPIDREAVIRAARETGAIVTAENHSVIGGLGSAVAEVVCRECPVPVGFVGIDDVFGEVGFTPLLMERFGLTAKHIAAKVMDTLGRK